MPKTINGFGAGGNKKTADEPETKIEVGLSMGQALTVARETMRRAASAAAKPSVKYTGNYLFKTGAELTVGVDIETEKDSKIKFEEGDIVLITYTDQTALFSFNAILTGVKKAPSDSYGYKYIFDAIPITAPEKQQRREFYRMNLATDIYCKKNEAEIKMRTIDFSAGGFRAKSKTPVKSGSVLECTVAVGLEALPASVKILSSKQETQNGVKNGLYDIRAIFCDMSDQIRDRIVRYIFAQQRKTQATRRTIKREEEIK